MRYASPLLSTALLLAAGAAPAAAADITVRDVRLVGGIAASNYESEDDSVDIDDGEQIGVLAITSFRSLGLLGGPVLGVEAAVVMADGDDAEVDTQRLTLHAGWAWAPPVVSSVHAEGGIYGSVGRQQIEAGGVDDSGLVTEWGLRVGGYWTFMGPFQLGADLRWLGSSESDLDLGAGEQTLENDGLVALLSLGIRI